MSPTHAHQFFQEEARF